MPATLCTVIGAGGMLPPSTPRQLALYLLIHLFIFIPANRNSVDDFVNCGLLVSGAGDDELVVGGDVAAEHRRRLLRLEYAGSIRRPPGVQEVIFAGAHKPFTTVGELE